MVGSENFGSQFKGITDLPIELQRAATTGRLVHHGGSMPIFPEEAWPSSDTCTAGASGFYVTKNLETAKQYSSRWVTHYILPTEAKIHPEISDFPELRHMRRCNQYANELREGSGETPEEIKENYYDKETNTEDARDVSLHLENKGYSGHMDSINGKDEMAYYNPEELKLIGATNREGKFFSAEELRRNNA